MPRSMTDRKPAQAPLLCRLVLCLLGFSCLGFSACSKSRAPAASRLGGKAGPRDEDKSAAHGRLSALVAEQLDAELQFSPTLATWLGDHSSDDRLDDVRIETVLHEIIRLDNLLERVRREDVGADLSPEEPLGDAHALRRDGGDGSDGGDWAAAGPSGLAATPASAAASADSGAAAPDAVAVLLSTRPRAQPAELPAAATDDAGAADAAADAGIAAGGSGDSQYLDRTLLQARIEARRFELVEWRPYERNPLYYANIIAFGLDSLLGPSLATPAGLRALRGRLAAIPVVCHEAQRNLKNPPELWTRRAIELTQMTRDFVAGLLPRMLANLNLTLDPKLQDEVNHQREDAQRALEDFGAWLSHDLLPRSKGDWVLPPGRLQARLRAAELLDVPLEVVQERAEFEHRETRHRLEELARHLTGLTSPSRAVAEVQRLIEEDHPRPDELFHAVESAVEKAYELVAAQALLTLPPQRPQVVEMPAYRFGYLQLSLPAPLEADRPAQLLVDPVDPSWKDKKRVSDHLRMLNRTQIQLSVAHEVMPGRFARHAAQRAVMASLSPLRQRSRSLAFLEGWAGYAEQLVAFGNGPGLLPTGVAAGPPSPGSERLQVLALRQQLLRLGRLIVALRLHAPASGSPSASVRMEQATDFFTEQCFLDEYAARREVDRATYDPLYGSAGLGRLQLLQLRADYQAEHHDDFSPKGFHDALLAQGALPVVALRELLLRQRGPSLRPVPEPEPKLPSGEDK